MNLQKVGQRIFMIDLRPAEIGKFIASYVVIGERIAIIDCGPASTIENLLNGLKELKVDFNKVDYVMISHAHIDHWGGANVLLRNLPNARVMIHPRGLPHLANPEKLWLQSKQVLSEVAEIFGEPPPVPKDRIIPSQEGAIINLGGEIEIQVIETLGHAPHHVSYFERVSGSLFTGEAAGIYVESLDVTLPATPPVIIFDKLLESLEKLLSLSPKILYYTHFGPAEDAVEKLKVYEKQLKIWRLTVTECCRNNETLDSVKEKLIQRDPCLKKALKYVKTHPIISRVFPKLIQGFMVE